MRRVDSWALRETVRAHPAATARQRACGSYRYATHVELRQMADGGTAWWHGVIQCRARMCPVCWIARRHKAGAEIAWTVGARERETGLQSFLLTLTVRHSASDAATITRQVRDCWKRFQQSRAFRLWKEEHGVQWIAAEEVTRGNNGWHPHLHILVMPDAKPIRPRDTWSLSASLYDVWRAAVVRTMGERYAPLRESAQCRHCGCARSRKLGEAMLCAACDLPWQGHAVGTDLRPCDAAGYLTKLGYELADPAAQKGDAPLALLERGELDAYMQLQTTRHGARDITFSRGLKEYRDSRPPHAGIVTLLALRGSDWGRLRHLGWEVPLEVASASDSARAAREAVEARLGPVEEPSDDVNQQRWD